MSSDSQIIHGVNMSSKINERLRKVEGSRAKASKLPTLVLWRDMDGTYSRSGEKWASVEDAHASYPGEYDGTMIFSWKNSGRAHGPVSE